MREEYVIRNCQTWHNLSYNIVLIPKQPFLDGSVYSIVLMMRQSLEIGKISLTKRTYCAQQILCWPSERIRDWFCQVANQSIDCILMQVNRSEGNLGHWVNQVIYDRIVAQNLSLLYGEINK